MSNAVDILFIGGPNHNVMYDVPKPYVSSYPMDFPSTGIVFYERRSFHHTNGKQYHVAVLLDSGLTDAYIEAMIDAYGMTPSWDLNP